MKFLRTAFVFLAVVCVGCREVPVPSEVLQAREQERELWREGASLHFGSAYGAYRKSLEEAERKAAKEKLRLGWIRDYGQIQRDFQDVLEAGEGILRRLEAFKREETDCLEREAGSVGERIEALDELTLSLGERGEGRRAIVQAGILLSEAESSLKRGEFAKARDQVGRAKKALEKVESAILSHIGRYLEEGELRSWEKWAAETVAESKRSGGLAIIISKLERRLTVYRNGRPIRSYDVGLGMNGLLTKTRSGDNATPEGKYRVVGKNPRSQYHKALLIDYPNREDKLRFARAQKEGRIPEGTALGGNIEIHGGGRDILTRGCVSMDDDQMDELFRLIDIGTPVTIIGTTDRENSVIRAIEKR